MSALAAWRRSALAIVSLAASTAVSAQVYRCSNGGATYLSDRPCVGTAPAAPTNRSQIGGYGPTQRERNTPAYTPHAAEAPAHLSYMSVECADLREGLRTGPARGLKGTTMVELSRNYHERCADNEAQAMQRLSDDRRLQKEQQRATDNAVRRERDSAVLATEQCNEQLRVLAAKRKRAATMTEGEKADLQIFEANYKARCSLG